MREIKFRAWDTKYDKWVYFTLGHLISGDVMDIAQRCKNWCECTPRKDKNGKEIYEGDIVNATAPRQHKDSDCVSDIIQDVNDTSWCVRTPRDDGNPYYFGLNINWWLELEVIGDIYKNKELLNAR